MSIPGAPDDDRVALHEIRPMRDQIRAMVTLRISGVPTRSLDEILIPSFVRNIVRVLVDEFRRQYPDGLPPPPASLEIVARYGQRAVKLYDAEIAKQFELGDA